jgi:4-amino-4-deoxy-L-arabinose transferase-like glycosyltransferase
MRELLASKHLPLLAVLVLAALPYFLGLGSSSLWDSNEAFYTETPRRMIETGDFISPEFNYQPRFNKPPLSYWVVALFYKLFGVSELSARLPVAIGALIMIITAFALGRAVFSVEAGFYAAIALAISPRILMFSRRIIIDVYVAMFMSLALLFFLLSEKDTSRRRLYLILMYISVGLGMLTKGPVALALPAITFFIYLVASKNLGRLRQMMLPAGALIILAIVLPWYVAVYARHGWDYIESFILRDNLSRYTQPVWGPRRGIFFYLPVILGDMFPWSVFLITAIWIALKKRLPSTIRDRLSAKDDSVLTESSNLSMLLWIWIAVIVVFFSLSRNKEDLYILPIYTAAAAIVGGLIAQISARWTTLLLAVLISLTGAASLYIFGGYTEAPTVAGASAIGIAAIAGGLITVALIILRQERAAIIATALTIIALNYIFVLKALPDFEQYKPVRAFSEIIRQDASPDALVGYYRFASPSMVFYLRRQVFEYYTEEQLRAALSSGKEVYCLIKDEDYKAVRETLPPTYVLATHPVFQVKLKSIFEHVERPQVLLISNKTGAAVLQ